MFSKACEYGIRAAIYIASESIEGRRCSMKDIAAEIDSPEAFTAKVLQQLVRSKVIDSVKGPSGGFEMHPSNSAKINLGNIVMAIDGDALYTQCGLGLKVCSDKHPCPAHFKYKKVRDELKLMLENTTVSELTTGMKKGKSYLKK